MTRCNLATNALICRDYKIRIIQVMQVSKFEAVGIGISVAAMALALFLIRVDTTFEGDLDNSDNTAGGLVFVEGEDQQASLGAALEAASSQSNGRLEKMIVNDVILGEGAEVTEDSTVEVHYVGTLQNGQQFDNSYFKGTPLTFTVGDGKVITGLEDGVVGMKEGGQRILVIPANLAYGDKGFGPIPGGATLVFAVELLSVK